MFAKPVLIITLVDLQMVTQELPAIFVYASKDYTVCPISFEKLFKNISKYEERFKSNWTKISKNQKI